ncbi:MAG: alkaline phosphatase family protein [Bacteroidetes bacterium]|nr:alkaline phosphatase family protein [Bacteroidota bacterium]
MKYCLCALLLLWFSGSAQAQDTTTVKILAGPFAGSVTKTSAKIWLAYKGSGSFSVTLADTSNKSKSLPFKQFKLADSKGDTALSLDFQNLEAGHTYIVTTEGLRTPLRIPDCSFTTIGDTTKDIDFLVGSCAYLSLGIMKAVLPGASVRIFHSMTRTKADFMIWLGDNIYYMGKEHSSYEKMYACNLKTRIKYPLLNNFLASMPQYTIWDDHDYGPNDADRNFPLKDTSLVLFRGFWVNPYEDSVHQTYFNYKYYDAEFFMTDDRWWRDQACDTGSFFGPEQSAWLKRKLLHSDASFKFICVGSQVLNEDNHGECYAMYGRERDALLDFIATNNIKGVVFLSGDMHYSEMSRHVWKGYPFYDFTCSPLTSPMDPRNYSSHNRYRVAGTVLFHKNYGRVKITGQPGNRICTIEEYNMDGHKNWDYMIRQQELQMGTSKENLPQDQK